MSGEVKQGIKVRICRPYSSGNVLTSPIPAISKSLILIAFDCNTCQNRRVENFSACAIKTLLKHWEWQWLKSKGFKQNKNVK